MKPQPSRSPYYQRAERCAFDMGGWTFTANRLGLTSEALQRVLGRLHSKDDKRIARDWCEQVENLWRQERRERRA